MRTWLHHPINADTLQKCTTAPQRPCCGAGRHPFYSQGCHLQHSLSMHPQPTQHGNHYLSCKHWCCRCLSMWISSLLWGDRRVGLFLKRITKKKGLLGLQACSSGSCPAGASGSPKCHANTTVCGATATSGVCQIHSFPFSSAFMSLSACSSVPYSQAYASCFFVFYTASLQLFLLCFHDPHLHVVGHTHTHTYRKVTNCECRLFFFSLFFFLFFRVGAALAAHA